jgi:hypothetical protein
MKTTFLTILMLLSLFTIKAQGDNSVNMHEKKNEIKLNVLLPLFGAFEVTYERILNKKSSLGVSFFAPFDSGNVESTEDDENYFISPYYRMYFGKKNASGFFAEGFGMLTSIDGKKIFDLEGNLSQGSAVSDFAIGLGFGSKWITKSGFIFEVNVGYGKLLFNADKTDHDIVAKFGFHLGYRF